MLITVKPNVKQLYQKIALQIALIVIFLVSLVVVIHPWSPLTIPQTLLMILFAVAFLIFNLFLVVQLLYLPIGVSFDETGKKMEIKFLLIKPMTIQVTDMEKFSSTAVLTKRREFEGVMLYVKGPKKILLSNINIENYKPVELFLKKARVKYAGKEEFAYLPYYKQWF